MTSFTNRKRKRDVQEELFKIAGCGLTATVLLGPDPEDYISLLRKHVTYVSSQHSKIIHGYDFNPTVNSKMGLKIYAKDISWAPATDFIDLDLCAGLLSSKYLLFSMWQKQQSLQGYYPRRVFMFTLSQRDNTASAKQIDIFKAIEEMIDCPLKIKRNPRSREIKVVNPTPGYEIHIRSYRDTTPMLTVLIKY